MNLQTIFRLAGSPAAIVAAAAIAMAACGGGSGSSVAGGVTKCAAAGYGGGGTGGGSTSGGCPPPATTPTPTPAASTASVGLLLSGENPMATASDGTVLGFFNGTAGNAPSGSGVVNLTANTNVQFVNIEPATGGLPHTASNLGAFTGSYPASFTNTNGPTPSAAGTAISAANFSSGNINPGATSAVYSSGGPGIFVFGCAYHYLSNNMRTVIIVK